MEKVKALLRKITGAIAVLRWAVGKSDQVYLLITNNNNKIRIVASPAIDTSGARDLCQLGLNYINARLKKEMFYGAKK